MSEAGAYVVLGAPAADDSPLEACLRARPRTRDAVRTTTAPDAGDVRALVLLDAGDDPEATAALVRALREAETPVLACGHGASVLAAALAGQPVPEPPTHAGRLTRLRRTDGADEPVVGDLVDGSPWVVVDAAGATVPDGSAVLAQSDEGAAAAFAPWPRCVAMWARVDLPARAVVELLEDPGDLAGREAFFDAWATTLVGRWVDEVVGRTDEEAPWGRRGPPPVYDEGLFLGARDEGWATPTR